MIELAIKIQENMKDEAQAVKGYTEQASIIAEIKERYPNLAEKCEEWERANDELIADELNHQLILNAMYTDITGVQAKKD